MENLNAWKDEENKTKLLAAFVLGTLFFWVPGYACDVADAFTNEKCLPRSIYLLSTFLFNVSHCVKPLIIAAIDGDFATEFKRILKFRKIRRVVDVNVQGNKLGGDPKFMPETRKYYCQTEEDDDANLTKANESNVWTRDKLNVLPKWSSNCIYSGFTYPTEMINMQLLLSPCNIHPLFRKQEFENWPNYHL